MLLDGVRASTCPVDPNLLPWGNADDKGLSSTGYSVWSVSEILQPKLGMAIR